MWLLIAQYVDHSILIAERSLNPEISIMWMNRRKGEGVSKLKVVYDCPWCDAAIDWHVFDFDNDFIPMCRNCLNKVELKAGRLVPFEPPDDELYERGRDDT